jgi:HTH-type transcriptional regulator / antitoxin HigA
MIALHPFTPDWTLRPGETLAEILIERRMSTEQAGRLTGLRPEEIEAVIHGALAVDGRVAERLAKLGPSARFWLNYQRNYDADIARGAKDVSREVL